MSGYSSMDEIRADNPGWFSEESMAFFRCIVYDDVWRLPNGDAVFVTSEQQGSDEFRELVNTVAGALNLGPGKRSKRITEPRVWTVRYATVGGGISTIGDGFGGYASLKEAQQAARLFVYERQTTI